MEALKKLNVDKVRGLRREAKKNQQFMADLIGVHITTYRTKESGETLFNIVEAKEIADYFNMKIEDVFFAPKLTER